MPPKIATASSDSTTNAACGCAMNSPTPYSLPAGAGVHSRTDSHRPITAAAIALTLAGE